MKAAGFALLVSAALVVAGGLAGGLAGTPAARAQFNLQSMANMDGSCRAEIEGRAVTCTGFASFARFGNGRSAFLFSHDHRLYTFSGSRLGSRGSEGFVLHVDTVRVAAEDVPDRDYAGARGECVVQAAGPAGPFAAIDCEARAPGVLAPYRFHFDQVSHFENKTYR